MFGAKKFLESQCKWLSRLWSLELVFPLANYQIPLFYNFFLHHCQPGKCVLFLNFENFYLVDAPANTKSTTKKPTSK